MATASIGALRYDIIADTKDFKKGMMLTRKELRAGERMFRKNETAQEKFQRQLRETGQMLAKGSISVATHRREVARLTQQYKETHTMAGRFAKGMKSRLGLFALATTATYSLQRAFRHLMEDMGEADKLQKASVAMGETAQNIQAIQFAAAQTAGLTDEQTINAIEKMTKRIGEAAQGMGEAQSALKLLRLDARKLVLLRPYEQFLLLADALEEVEDAGTRAMLAQKLFDMEAKRIAITMKGGAAAIEKYRKLAESRGMLLDDKSIENMVRANDAVDRMTRAWDRLSKVLSGGIAPVLETIANKLEDIANIVGVLNLEFKTKVPQDMQTRGGLMLKRGVEEVMKGGSFGQGLAKGWIERTVQKRLPTWMRTGTGEKPADVARDKEQQTQGWMKLLGWFKKDSAEKKVFKRVDKPKAETTTGSGASPDELGIQSLVGGTTAEQNSLEEYRFLVEKQQRENQALLLEGNTEALIENTNALLNTTDREGKTRPTRPDTLLETTGSDLQL